MPWTEEEMAAEAEADSLKEATRNRPPAPKAELVAQLNSAVTTLVVGNLKVRVRGGELSP